MLASDFGCVLRTTSALALGLFRTHRLKMDAAPSVAPLRLSPQTKSSFPGGRGRNTSRSSSSGINHLWALLRVGGGDNILFSESASQRVLHRLCAAGARVERNVYPGLGDDPVVYGSLREQLDWIAARFAREPPPGNCPAPQAFNGRHGPRTTGDRQLSPRW